MVHDSFGGWGRFCHQDQHRVVEMERKDMSSYEKPCTILPSGCTDRQPPKDALPRTAFAAGTWQLMSATAKPS